MDPLIGQGFGGGLDNSSWFLGLNAEGGGDEALQGLAWGPGPFAHEADAWWVVLQAGVHAGVNWRGFQPTQDFAASQMGASVFLSNALFAISRRAQF